MSVARRELFAPGVNPRDVLHQSPDRPLGPVSDLVRVMPGRLTAIRRGDLDVVDLIREVDGLIGDLPASEIDGLLAEKGAYGIGGYYPFSHKQDVAGFHLKMAESAVVHSGGVPTQRHMELVDKFSAATGTITGLDYEGYVYTNPQADLCTFTDGEAGQAEFDFIAGHRRIESRGEGAVRGINYALNRLEQGESGSVDLAVAELRRVTPDFSAILEDLEAIGFAMHTEQFAGFRPYLGSHPVRNLPESVLTRELLRHGEKIPEEHTAFLREHNAVGLKGPSGAFTPVLPVVEALLYGEHLPQSRVRYLIDNLDYFPRLGRGEIRDALSSAQQGRTLTAISRSLGNPSDLVAVIGGMQQQILQFRETHLAVVRHQLDLNVNTIGTAGEDPSRFLKGRIKTTQAIIGRTTGATS